jgi:hypothetical protein
MISIWEVNELPLIDELDENENQFILFVKMVPIIHWHVSAKKNGYENLQLWVRACLGNL